MQTLARPGQYLRHAACSSSRRGMASVVVTGLGERCSGCGAPGAPVADSPTFCASCSPLPTDTGVETKVPTRDLGQAVVPLWITSALAGCAFAAALSGVRSLELMAAALAVAVA